MSELIEAAQEIHPFPSDYFLLYIKNTSVLSTRVDMHLFKI
jgi:hypothetical protein